MMTATFVQDSKTRLRRGQTVRALVAAAACAAFAASTTAQEISPEMAKQVQTRTINNVHVAGKILHGGKASGADNKMHLEVGVKLATPVEGIDSVEATVTHNEPSEQIRKSIEVYSGHARQVGTVDLTCPSVRIVTFQGKTMAMGQECTFHNYDGPILVDQ